MKPTRVLLPVPPKGQESPVFIGLGDVMPELATKDAHKDPSGTPLHGLGPTGGGQKVNGAGFTGLDKSCRHSLPV